MEKEFVPYESALKLKQLGLDEECLADYSLQKGFEEQFKYAITPCQLELLAQAPTYSQAFRWFRDKHNLVGHVRESWSFDNTMEYVSQINGTFVNHGLFDKPVNRFNTYEEAELACLEKLIEIVEQRNADMTEHGVYK